MNYINIHKYAYLLNLKFSASLTLLLSLSFVLSFSYIQFFVVNLSSTRVIPVAMILLPFFGEFHPIRGYSGE